MGAITDTYQIDAFGAQITSTGTTPNPYLYSGERFDNSLNLYHLRARYYNMLTGRFETVDPVGRNLFDPATLHRYVYTRNDPVDRVDPRGTDDVEGEAEILFEVQNITKNVRRIANSLQLTNAAVGCAAAPPDLPPEASEEPDDPK